ncbi:IucA/IucC family protein [Paenibacillus sp. CCS19]|uniref:IucA/IucC family protein n=1 Tax=Paenibacillus sp. CCS19 TaxID=3158387 RepID=UPI00295E6BDB|nr:IucA/IucC family protein [Paenibacillus cellulosilyticus]
MVKQRQHEARDRANWQTCQTLLNCYIREVANENSDRCEIDSRTGVFKISFAASEISLSGQMRFSPMGEHDYLSIRVSSGEPLTSAELARWIVKEVRSGFDGITDEMESDFVRRVANSCSNIALFVAERGVVPVDNYLASEQSLLFGHPFHPYPKNTIGFEADDVKRFAPELRASFQLCYLAVHKEAFHEEWLPSADRIGPHPSVLAHAREMLGEAAGDYRLLPVHPWQYEHIHSVQAIKERMEEGVIVPLGSCGPMAYPTSSVRTVYVPDMKCNVKLPLDIQITNLKRNNTREQMRRTMDAAFYLQQAGCFEQEPHIFAASEEGVLGCRLGDEAVESLLTVAFRPVHYDPASTYVLASLVETPAGEGPSRLSCIMASSQVETWVRRYLDLSLLPIVRTAEEKGIHFEAHLQNSLLTVRNGMPDTFLIRDLEGVSVERDHALSGWDTSGPLFYSREQARARTTYYFMVNHLGSLLHAIARDMGAEETSLWAIVREKLEQELASSGNDYARFLLTTDVFRAKRNLASCLAGRGETPSFADVRNPMTIRESERIEDDRQYV